MTNARSPNRRCCCWWPCEAPSLIYQGEELGLPQGDVPVERLRDPEAIANWPLTLGRDGARTPMPWRSDRPNAGFSEGEPWLPLDPSHRALAVDAQETDPDSMLHFTRRAIGLRRRFEALRSGNIVFQDAPETLLMFSRGCGRDEMLCVFNFGARPVDWTLPKGWEVVESVNLAGSATALPALASLLAQRK